MTGKQILIVEDEKPIRDMIAFGLRRAGFDVREAEDCSAARASIADHRPDLLLVDWMLPDQSGLELTRAVKRGRDTQDLPVIMLTARADEQDKVTGLEGGADDYVTKPFSPRELLARVKALLRRSRSPENPSPAGASFGDVDVDFKGYSVKKKGNPVELTVREFELLRLLVTHPDEVLRRDTILNEVWGDEWDVFPRTIDTHVVHLRQKLEDDPAEPRHIVNVRGVGYKFVSDPP